MRVAPGLQLPRIQFDLEDKTSALSAARKSAVESAYLKAQELATASEVTISSVQIITERSDSYPMSVIDIQETLLMPAEASVPISSGPLEIMVEVKIVYKIE